jgi:hypothetical protein
VSQPATLNFKLTVGSTAQIVEVSASSTINFSDASLGNAIDNAQIEAMPIDSRNVADLLSLQPGVLYFGNNNSASNPARTQDSRLGAVAGARSDQGNITLDGLNDNDQTFGYAFTGVLRSTLDSTQEYRVTTANSNADSGRSSGPQVTLVTKSRTNSFHGSAYEIGPIATLRPMIGLTKGLGRQWPPKQAAPTETQYLWRQNCRTNSER